MNWNQFGEKINHPCAPAVSYQNWWRYWILTSSPWPFRRHLLKHQRLQKLALKVKIWFLVLGNYYQLLSSLSNRMILLFMLYTFHIHPTLLFGSSCSIQILFTDSTTVLHSAYLLLEMGHKNCEIDAISVFWF